MQQFFIDSTLEINQEKIELKMLENFIHYHGINSCENKLTNLITHFSESFIRMDEFVLKNKKM